MGYCSGSETLPVTHFWPRGSPYLYFFLAAALFSHTNNMYHIIYSLKIPEFIVYYTITMLISTLPNLRQLNQISRFHIPTWYLHRPLAIGERASFALKVGFIEPRGEVSIAFCRLRGVHVAARLRITIN